MLRKPEISLIIKDIYIPKPTPESEATRKPETAVILNPNSNTVADTPPGATNPSSFPMVQPLRAALHFDSPEGARRFVRHARQMCAKCAPYVRHAQVRCKSDAS